MRVQYANFDLPGKHLPIFDRHDESVQIGPSMAGARGSGYCI
jgi:hypothetical protein